MPQPNILTESEIDAILQKLTSTRDKVRLMTHLSVARAWNLNNPPPSSAPSPNVAASISKWIRDNWPGDTVRAAMARKIADMIDANEWLPEAIRTKPEPTKPEPTKPEPPKPEPTKPEPPKPEPTKPEPPKPEPPKPEPTKPEPPKPEPPKPEPTKPEPPKPEPDTKNMLWGARVNGVITQRFATRAQARAYVVAKGGVVADLRSS